jgi:hypothetical protein
VIKREKKADLIQLSIKYDIVTQWTSFVAIEERKPGEVQKNKQPPMSELIAAETVDALPYIGACYNN